MKIKTVTHMMIALTYSVCALLAGCSSAGSDANIANSNIAVPTPAVMATASPAPTADIARKREPSLVSLSAGAFPVKKLGEYSTSFSTLELIDERPATMWNSPEGSTAPETLVLSLPEKTLLKNVIFDCGNHETNTCAKDLTVEMSDTNADTGFQKIAAVSIEEGKEDQSFPVSAEVPGHWVRLTVLNNHGATRYTQLNDFRATGTQLTHTPIQDISGTYDTNEGDMHIRQEGTSVTGCYYTRGGIFQGGVDGRVLKIGWTENYDQPSKETGTAIFAFSADGKEFLGGYSDGDDMTKHLYKWTGKKKSNDIGTCPGWAGGVEAQTSRDLATEGRVRLYGINFDTDSDVIRDESKPTLDKMVAIMRKNAEWKISIEGHTDATATASYNQALSERRAASVRKYIEAGGIAANRLSSIGYGDTKPVADNQTEFGRAQNRRVELAKL